MIPYYYGADLEYANKRLGGTFINTVHNRLFYLTEVATTVENKKVKLVANGTFISDDPNASSEAALLPVEELDMSPLQLGYVFCRKRQRPVFVSRLPMRNAYRQGLSMNTIETSEGTRNDISATDLLMPVYSRYPNLKTARDMAVKGYGQPFSRQFAINPEGLLVYRGRAIVGKIEGDAKPVAVLSPQHAFLQQHLDWVLK
jgi:hypothetical protein